MKGNRFWAGLLGTLVAIGSAFTPKDAEGAARERQPVYVDDVKAPNSVPSGSTVEVTVSGNLPTPAWEIEKVDVKKAGHTVTITVWGRQASDSPGIQVLQPFTRKVAVPGLTPGMWTIEVVGHGDTGEAVQVEVH